MPQAIITPHTTLVRNDTLVTAAIPSDLFILDVDTGAYYALDEIGKDIWERLQKPTPVSELCQQLTAQYEVSPDQCQADVLALMRQLTEQGLAHVVD